MDVFRCGMRRAVQFEVQKIISSNRTQHPSIARYRQRQATDFASLGFLLAFVRFAHPWSSDPPGLRSTG